MSNPGKERRKSWLSLPFVAFGLVAVISLLMGLWLRLTNVELTETQLFLKYWDWWIVDGIGLTAAYFWVRLAEDN